MIIMFNITITIIRIVMITIMTINSRVSDFGAYVITGGINTGSDDVACIMIMIVVVIVIATVIALEQLIMIHV